jgi:SSS family solute:Na+ symporter
MARHLPLVIAFAILAAYTYQSGLRAPALIAFVKDTLIYIVIIVAVLYIPYALGGWGAVFDAAEAKFTAAKRGGMLLAPGSQLQYITLAFGSALALFLYPHSVTGVLASKNRDIIKRNMAALPAYHPRPARTAGLHGDQGRHRAPITSAEGKPDNNTIVPLLFDKMLTAGSPESPSQQSASEHSCRQRSCRSPRRTCGRNIYKEYINKGATRSRRRARNKLASLVVKFGALLAIWASTRSSRSTCS